jgi:Restriction endonuclease
MLRNNLDVLIIDRDTNYAEELASQLKLLLVETNLRTIILSKPEDIIKEVTRSFYDIVVIYFHIVPGYTILRSTPTEDLVGEISKSSPRSEVIGYFNIVPRLSLDGYFLNGRLAPDLLVKKPEQPASLASDVVQWLQRNPPKPQENLVIPVKQTIEVINERLINRFYGDPEKLRDLDPIIFERVIAELFLEEGYEIVLTPPRADGGKDIYVYKTDPLTQTMFLVECKRYTPPNKVTVEIARQLYGVVQQERASGGIIVTTSYFTKVAKQFASTVPYQLFLRDFDYLAQWLKKHNKSN